MYNRFPSLIAFIIIIFFSYFLLYTVKRLAIFPSPAGMSLTKLWPEIIKLFPARENLVSDIPAGDGKIANRFYSDILSGYKDKLINKLRYLISGSQLLRKSRRR
jgi:hypothetical protein